MNVSKLASFTVNKKISPFFIVKHGDCVFTHSGSCADIDGELLTTTVGREAFRWNLAPLRESTRNKFAFCQDRKFMPVYAPRYNK